MLANEFNSSKQYVDNLSVNTKRGLRQKVRRGEMPGGAPLGYYNDMRTKTAKVDKKIAPIIKQAFELYARGDKRLDEVANFCTSMVYIPSRESYLASRRLAKSHFIKIA